MLLAYPTKDPTQLETSHTPDPKKDTITFDKENVCDACKTAQTKTAIDWQKREEELIELCNKYRRNDENMIVWSLVLEEKTVSVTHLKIQHGMNPLTVTWSLHLYTDWGWRNFKGGYMLVLTTYWLHSGKLTGC